MQGLFGLVLLRHVHAVVDDERLVLRQLDAPAAQGDVAVDAVAAADAQHALPFLAGFEIIQSRLEDGVAG